MREKKISGTEEAIDKCLQHFQSYIFSYWESLFDKHHQEYICFNQNQFQDSAENNSFHENDAGKWKKWTRF